jgi:hypothetical protein
VRPILRRQQIDVLNGDPDHGIPARIELQLCGPSDSPGPLANVPIVIVYSADDDPNLGEELRLPIAALQGFIELSVELITSPPSTHTSESSPPNVEGGEQTQ